jgi:phosphoserine / homoserine phosphotransferase
MEGRPVEIACLDLEGVLAPEIWLGVAERTGIEALRATTRDVPDYDLLMKRRLRILEEHDLRMPDIQAVIDDLEPLDGAMEFLGWLNERYQVLILSDTFYEFAWPIMRNLDWPTLFCHYLEVDDEGRVVNYRLRLTDHKRKTVAALHGLNFKVIAAGDSYNDISMLKEADQGVLYMPPANVTEEFPEFPATWDYDQLRAAFTDASRRLDND